MHGMQEVRSSILLISTIKNTITTRFMSRVVIFFVCVHIRLWVYEKENMGKNLYYEALVALQDGLYRTKSVVLPNRVAGNFVYRLVSVR